MNLISRESLTNKSCKAFTIYPYTLSFGAKRAGVRLSTTPAPFTIMKLQPFETKQGGHDWHWILKHR
jgi:hypothetical protein